MRLALISMVTLLTAAPVLAGWDDDCKYTAERVAATPSAGVTKIVMHTGSGFLKVTGTPGATEIAARGTACTSDEDFLPKLNVKLRKANGVLYVDSTMPEKVVVFGFFSARLDLGVTVPAGIPVEIDDGSGSITVTNTGATTIEDGSGSIEVRDIAGDLTIEDGSGEIVVRNVRGNVEIEDGSGAIDIASVQGSIRMREDGSGSISIREIAGDVRIGRDGSGSIDVADVRGGFTVGSKGSGHIDHVRVAGKVEIPTKD
jgi:DUF4097 and DUF4098 domain-containing protein YvlB